MSTPEPCTLCGQPGWHKVCQVIAPTPGAYQRRGYMLVLTAPTVMVDTSWAMGTLRTRFPPNAARYVWGISHGNEDLSLNLAVEDALRLPTPPDALLFLRPPGIPAWSLWDTWHEKGRALTSLDGSVTVVGTDVLRALPAPWWEDTTPRGWGADVIGGLDEEPLDPTETPGQRVDYPEVSIALCIPTLGKVSLPWIIHFFQMAYPVASVRYLVVIRGHEVAEAREQCVELILSMPTPPKWFTFLGDDNLMPVHGWTTLMDAIRWKGSLSMCGVYRMKVPYSQPLLWRADHPGMLQPGLDYTPGDIISVSGTGLDATLLQTAALQRMAEVRRPLFKTGLEKTGRDVLMHTEDAYFWSLFHEATGEKPWVHTGVDVGHYDAFTGRVY